MAWPTRPAGSPGADSIKGRARRVSARAWAPAPITAIAGQTAAAASASALRTREWPVPLSANEREAARPAKRLRRLLGDEHVLRFAEITQLARPLMQSGRRTETC